MGDTPPAPSSWRRTAGPRLVPASHTLPGPRPADLTLPLRFAFNDEGRRVVSRQHGVQPVDSGAGVTEGKKYVGLNSSGVSYWSSEMPFLNLFKGASSNEGEGSGHPFNLLASWCTFSSTAWETDESAYLQLDSDGYPTSLIAKPTPPGGQKFTGVQASSPQLTFPSCEHPSRSLRWPDTLTHSHLCCVALLSAGG